MYQKVPESNYQQYHENMATVFIDKLHINCQ